MARSISELFPVPPAAVTVTAESVIGLADLLAAKQGVLTAGENVSIQNGVISASVQSAVQAVNGQTGNVTITAASLGAATATTVAAAVSDHAANADAHPHLLTQAQADARYLQVAPVTAVNGQVGNVTVTALSIGAELAGTAEAEINFHEQFSDPHPQYLNIARADARYLQGAHSHSIADVTGLQTALDEKAATGHAHSWASVTDKPAVFPPSAHNHVVSDVTGLQTALDEKASAAHAHTWSEITGKPTEFSPAAHNHSISAVTGLQTALDGKASTGGQTFSGPVSAPRLQSGSQSKGSVSGAVSVDTSLAEYVTATVTGATTFSFTNPPAAGDSAAFMLELTNAGAAAITWPASVKWEGGTAPSGLPAAGVTLLVFVTRDAGTTWHGAVVSKDSK